MKAAVWTTALNRAPLYSIIPSPSGFDGSANQPASILESNPTMGKSSHNGAHPAGVGGISDPILEISRCSKNRFEERKAHLRFAF